ncbi:MAG TPA: hypothetical protein DCM41_03750 [Synergistaceae bacterium]|nr:hypothetical protein [Synergistaceae bacterium]
MIPKTQDAGFPIEAFGNDGEGAKQGQTWIPARRHTGMTGGDKWGRSWMMTTQYLSEKHPTGVSRESIANQLVLSS